MSTRIIGASVWEQDMYDYVSGHVATEGAILEDISDWRTTHPVLQRFAFWPV